jgi:hypothetical protein
VEDEVALEITSEELDNLTEKSTKTWD